MRTRIKICGITNLEDARVAVDNGADALGFIEVAESPRCITYKASHKIQLALSPFLSYVSVVKALRWPGIGKRCVQFYAMEGDFQAEMWDYLRVHRTVIRAFRVNDESIFAEIEVALATHPPHSLLLDTYHKDKLGGSGETFNWELAVEAKRRFDLPIILAGGLTPENVGDAIAKVRPYAVDVSSGVEAEPGRKDHAKLKAFFRAVREADALLAKEV